MNRNNNIWPNILNICVMFESDENEEFSKEKIFAHIAFKTFSACEVTVGEKLSTRI